MQILKDIISQGTEGDYEAFHSWCRMYHELSQMRLPEKFSAYKNHFESSFTKNRSKYQHECKDLDLDEISKHIKSQVKKKIIRQDKMDGRSKFLLSDLTNSSFNNLEGNEVVFLTNVLKHEPIYFFRSKIKNWFRLKGIGEDDILDVSIAVTEAVENAIKYSDQNPIIIEHSFSDRTYKFNIHNSVTHTTVDLEDEDFSKGASLMRGILIMSKIFHSFDIDRNEEKQIVSLKGEITIS